MPSSQRITAASLPLRAGKVCVAVSGPAMIGIAADHLPWCRFVEFRLDTVPRPADLLPGLRAFLAGHTDVTAIATCRRTAFGGQFEGSAADQIALLRRAAEAGCALVDIEVETVEELGEDAPRALRAAGAAVIVSWHDFEGTPPLEPVYDRLSLADADFIKIVPTARSLRDSLRLLELLERHGGRGDLIAMSMALRGVLTRVLGPRYGSAFTFAAPVGVGGTAPGQVDIRTLDELYRIRAITADTAVYAVAGDPIRSSKSPLMHNTAFAATGLDAVYLPLETADAGELREAIERLALRGVSVTMPLKEAVLPLLTREDETVRSMRACNTLAREPDGSLAGYNTDIAGIVRPLSQTLDLAGAQVLVVGAGGAARAAVSGLRAAGAEVSLLNRTVERAAALAQEFGATVLTREAVAGRRFDAIVQTTPYGMRGQDLEAPLTAEELNCRVFFDLVYNPLETLLVKQAREHRIETIQGLAMFVEQGVRQFEIWTNQAAPREAMQRAVFDALLAEQSS